MLPAHRLALAVGEPHEARLLALLEDPALQVAGRGCVVTSFCSTIRELREAIGQTDSIDAVIVSSTLHALPLATLHEVVQTGRPLVLLVPDPTAAPWAEIPVPVLGLDTDGAGLAAAIGEALLGRGRVRPRRSRSTIGASPAPAGPATSGTSRPAHKCEVITVTSAETPDGKTSAVAVPLAYALSFAGPTVLLDVSSRGSAVEFHLPVDPARGLPQLGRRTLEADGSWKPSFADDEAWRAALESELQPMGPGQGRVACGISTPAYHQYLTEQLLERTIGMLRASRRFVVLDSSGSGWLPTDPALDRSALLQADRLLVVLRPDEQGIQRTRRLLKEPSGPHRERIGLVLNQVGLPGTNEGVGSIEYMLGAAVVASLPFDTRHVAAARAQHRPVVCEPGCHLSKPLLELAARLAGGGPIRLPASSPRRGFLGPWWRRLPVGATTVFRS